MGQRNGGEEPASEAPSSHAPLSPAEDKPAELVRNYTRPQLNALAYAAYKSGDPANLSLLGALAPEEKEYLATRKEFQSFIIALMYDAVLGNERVTKGQRAAAAWFHRVIKETADGNAGRKKGRIPEGAEITDSGGVGGDDE